MAMFAVPPPPLTPLVAPAARLFVSCVYNVDISYTTIDTLNKMEGKTHFILDKHIFYLK